MSLHDEIAQEVRKSLGVPPAVEAVVNPRRRTHRAAAPLARRVPTHAERAAVHQAQIDSEEHELQKIRKSNAERLRKHVIDTDAVLRTADLLAKPTADGRESVNSGDIALVTGLPEAFVEKVLDTKWKQSAIEVAYEDAP